MSRFKKQFLFLYNGGLDPDIANFDELRVRRICSSMILLLTPIGSIMLLLNVLVGATDDNYSIVFGLLLIFSCLFIQAYLNSRVLAANIVLFAIWVMPATIMQSYGVQGTTMMWMLPQPAIAVLLTGRRNGCIWALICCATAVFFGYLHANGLIDFDTMNHDYVPSVGFPNAIEAVILIAISTGAAVIFRTIQKDTEGKLSRLVDDLQGEVLSRRLAEQDARLAEQSKTAFLAAMSHEIRTPLNGVITATRLLVEASSELEKQEYSEIVLGSSETLLELVSDVMDLSAMDSGKLNISPTAVSSRGLLTETVRPFYFLAKEKDIGLNVEVADDLPEFILVDPTRAKQILINLLGNSIKFTDKGSVTVRLFRELNKIVLVVEDTGVGISDEEQSKLFEPFVQANSSTKQAFGGSGLGLTIVKKIVSAVQGNITIESRLGEGSKFSVYFPYIVPNTKSIEKLATQQHIERHLEPLNLLVADDNAVNRMVLARLLEKDNHNVVSVNDGQEALNYLKAHDVDAVLMDIQMPNMNGEQAAAAIRQLPPPKSLTKIIAITANASNDDAQRLLASNFDGFLAKPFRREALMAVLQLAGPAHILP